MDGPHDFKTLQEQVQASLIAITRSVGRLAGEDLAFQRSLNTNVGTALDQQSARLLSLSSQLLQSAVSIAQLKAPRLADVDDVEHNWRGTVDVIDSLLEKADGSLDEYTGVVKRVSSSVHANKSIVEKKKNPYALGNEFKTQNLVKPQKAFEHPINNHETGPWKPLLESKPHAIVDYKDSFKFFTDEYGQPQYHHPYSTEIQKAEYPEAILHKADPVPYADISTTSAIFVDTYEGVLQMLEELKHAKEIAIDLEHHDARSYVGLVSLMQISTRNKDWIVDTLKPWRQNLQILNEVFTDPNIIKIFHGAHMDMLWLQRDLGLYVVSLFDTYHACRQLSFPAASLAYLLKRFVDFDADKKYQMADWRIRPLPEEMFFYARSDTHFLLYIFDNLRNELIDASTPEMNKLANVLHLSRQTAQKRYSRAIYDEQNGYGAGGWLSMLEKLPMLLNPQQLAVFRAVHAWRDRIARQDDDGPVYIMPNHVITTIAKAMPTELVALYGSVHPISPNVKSRITELLKVVKQAIGEGAKPEAPNMMDLIRPNSVGAALHASRASDTPKPTTTVVVDEAPLRSTTSSFWGQVLENAATESETPTTKPTDIRLAIPLPQVAAEAFSDASMQAPPPAEPISEYVSYKPAKIEEDEAFRLKQGRKRKSDAPAPITSPPTEATDGNYDMSFEAEAPKHNRASAKKAEKRIRAELAAKNASAAMDVDGENEEEEEAFDYSKAESVLNSKAARVAGASGRKSKKNKGVSGPGGVPFDPYKKSENAAKGMRRVQNESAGRSFTFKK